MFSPPEAGWRPQEATASTSPSFLLPPSESRASSPPPLTSRLKKFCNKAGSPGDPTLKCGRKPQTQSPPSRGRASYTVLPPSVQKGAVGAWKKQVTRKLPPPRAKCQCTDIHTLSSVGYMAGPPPIPRVAYGKDEVP